MSSRLVPIVVVVLLGESVSLTAQTYPHQNNLQRQYPYQRQQPLQRYQQQQQQQRQMLQQQMQPQEVHFEGTISSASHGAILATDSTGRPWKVVIPATAAVDVTGTAEANFLKAGMMVDFKTAFDDRGEMKEKVGELTVIPSTDRKSIGILPADGSDPADAKNKPGKRGGKSGDEKGEPPPGPCRIVGKLVNNHGTLSVQVRGMQPIALNLSDSAVIKVEFDDYSAAQSGDSISVKGMAPPGRVSATGRPMNDAQGGVQATEVKITLAKPLQGARKPPAAKTSAQKSKKDAEP